VGKLSGWVAYSYGRNRQTDGERKETFWGDFDQRHAIKLSALYRLSDRTSVAIKFRGGTNFPIPGYLTGSGDALYAASRRNEVRLPGYARLDARAERSFDYGRRRLTVFVEVLNVLNRTNVGLADGVVNAATGRATGFTVPLFPRLPSAGIRIDF
jgi:TonB dependent receptor